MKVMLFGSIELATIPKNVEEHLVKIVEQTGGNVEFLVGDASGIDSAFHLTLSRIGAKDKTTLYCMNFPRNNNYDLKTRVIDGGNLAGRELYEVKDKQMADDCDFAICVWNGISKGTFNNINILKARNKSVYVYTVNPY